MKKRDSSILTAPERSQGDVTREVVGVDADMDEARVGSAGNGASPYGADFTGGYPEQLEAFPDQPADITPDRIERWPGLPAEAEEEEEREVTARPSEPRPPDPSQVPP